MFIIFDTVSAYAILNTCCMSLYSLDTHVACLDNFMISPVNSLSVFLTFCYAKVLHSNSISIIYPVTEFIPRF